MRYPREGYARRKTVLEFTGLPEGSLDRYVREGKFPRPYKLVGRAVGWRWEELHAWADSRPRTGKAAA